MSIISHEIDLRTNDELRVLRMSNIERSGESYVCDLSVRSGGFACVRPFYFDQPFLEDAVNALLEMNSCRPGEAVLKAHWDDDFVSLKSNDRGHVFVIGELFYRGELEQMLRFGFQTDQTVLGPFVSGLKMLLDL